MLSMKIAIIGAGSSYTPEVMEGLFAYFSDLVIELYDLPEGAERVRIIKGLAERMARKKQVKAVIEIADTLDSALEGCHFVISQFRVGLLQARIADEKIPLQYGLIGQETTGAGGFFCAMRTIPPSLALASKMEAICPEAWLINFTNPSGIITEAIHRHSSIRVVGLCNVPYNMHVDAARVLGAETERVYCRMVGLNHLSFVTEVYLDGKPALQQLIDRRCFDAQLVKNIPKIPGIADLIAKLRMVPSPYLQYYYYEDEMLAREMRDVQEGKGTRGEQVLSTQDRLFEIYKQPTVCEKPKELEMRGGAYYSTVAADLIRALSGNGPVATPVNYPNKGAIQGLSDDSVIEANCLVDRNGVQPLAYGALPESIRGLICQVKSYETLAIEAAYEHSYDKAVLALMNHPLVHGYENAVRLVDNMIRNFGQYVGVLH